MKNSTSGEIICQGTVIDVNWVLTSAQCVKYILYTRPYQKIKKYWFIIVFFFFGNYFSALPDDVELTMGNKAGEIFRKLKRTIVEENNGVALIEVKQLKY